MKKKKNSGTILLVGLIIIGLSLLLYPTISNYVNEKNSAQAISTYVEQLDYFDEEQFKEAWNNAIQYNADLAELDYLYSLPEEMSPRYEEQLNITGDGVMGYVDIPKLKVSLPVYHYTSDKVLQHAIGHIEWSSLPVGGESSHCVVSGHRGLPTAKLFTDIDKLREGDVFELTVLNVKLTYQVDQIRTVLPEDVDDLQIVEGKDYCTLVTCTPYGINTHRLLVRGHRIENVIAGVNVVSEAVIVDQLIVALVIAFPILLVFVLVIMLRKPKKKAKKRRTTLS